MHKTVKVKIGCEYQNAPLAFEINRLISLDDFNQIREGFFDLACAIAETTAVKQAEPKHGLQTPEEANKNKDIVAPEPKVSLEGAKNLLRQKIPWAWRV